MFSALVEKDQGHKMGLQIPSNRFTSVKKTLILEKSSKIIFINFREFVCNVRIIIPSKKEK